MAVLFENLADFRFLFYDVFVRCALIGDFLMADVKKVELANLEVQWVRKSVELQISSLKRSLIKEMPGSDIYALRQREIADLQGLLSKF